MDLCFEENVVFVLVSILQIFNTKRRTDSTLKDRRESYEHSLSVLPVFSFTNPIIRSKWMMQISFASLQ